MHEPCINVLTVHFKDNSNDDASRIKVSFEKYDEVSHQYFCAQCMQERAKASKKLFLKDPNYSNDTVHNYAQKNYMGNFYALRGIHKLEAKDAIYKNVIL